MFQPMKKLRVVVHVIVLLLLLLVSAVSAGGDHHHNNLYKSDKSFSRHYLVELNDNISNATDMFIHYIHNHHLDNEVHIHRAISHQFLKAVSIEIKDVEKEYTILKLLQEDHDHVESISPIQAIKRTEFISPSIEVNPAKKVHNLTAEQVDLVSPHRLSQVNRVHNELNLTGEGLFIGIIDSGVDYYHPALGGGFGNGFKVATGYDLVGSHWNSSDPKSQLEPDDDPLDDCGKNSSATGHGTHVSGIIAGYDLKNGFKGVAFGAKIGMWRVFSCTGSARNDVVIHAMLMAYDAGVDIISMSLGSTTPWSSPHDLQSKIVSKISASGVSMVISAGNNGKKGAFTTGAPGNVLSAFEVASVNNEYTSKDGSFTATTIPDPIEFSFMNDTDLTMTDGNLALSYDGDDDPTADACTTDSVSKNVHGKIVLVKRGECNFTVKVANIAAASGIGAIIYDNINQPNMMIVVKNVTIPVLFISLKNGNALRQAYKKHPGGNILLKFASKENGTTFVKSDYATTVSSFSSVGPTAELDFKPSIAAVGQLIYSTLPRYMGSWGIKEGTSMACPYISGSIALYLQYHGINKTTRRVVHEKFQNYAFISSVDNRTSGVADNPIRQGAGLVQVYDTILQTSHVSPAQITFNDTFTTAYQVQNLTVTNSGLDDISYRIFNNVSVSVSPYNRSASGYTFLQPAATLYTSSSAANITFSVNEVHLKSGQSQTIQLTVSPPNTDPLDHTMYGGFIQFDPLMSQQQRSQNNTKKALHVPYFGIVGSQRDLPVIDEKFSMTVRNNVTNITYGIHDTVIYDFTAFTFKKKKPMSLLIDFKLTTATLIVKGEVLEGSTHDFLGYAFQPLTYVERDFVNDTHPRRPLVWNGQYLTSIPYNVLGFSEDNVPKIPQDQFISVKSGNYSIRVSALKQFGNLDNTCDWESFLVENVVVKRE